MPELDEEMFFEWPPATELMRGVAGVEPDKGGFLRVEGSDIRCIQRFTIRQYLDGLALMFWPGESKPQAEQLYTDRRAERMLAAARADGWQDITPRPHLSYWNAPARDRCYLSCQVPVEDYVARWCDEGPKRVRNYSPAEVRDELWPWLREQGFAGPEGEEALVAFLARLGMKRPARLRPGLRFLRLWSAEEYEELVSRGAAVHEVRDAINRVLAAGDDGQLPIGLT